MGIFKGHAPGVSNVAYLGNDESSSLPSSWQNLGLE